ncbi:unnamed protein product [Owenia fusiformis]|uniref:Uncharacterized protein n=1 Tax=Owenia fusiformis TaxID=6347 RepID=A0A8S4MZG3_OWEFU|nr:unnamed protein product [Owenia fusiformis]
MALPTASTHSSKETNHLDSILEDGKLEKTFLDFSGKTTAHGCGQIAKAKYKILKLIWMVIFFGALSFATYSSGIMFMKYYKYPTKDVVSLTYDDLEFPSVTFCNLQPFALSSTITFSPDDILGPNNTLTALLQFMFNVRSIFINPNKLGLGDMFQRYLNRIISYQFVYENVNAYETEPYVHDLKNFLIGCTFKGEQCNRSMFVLQKDSHYHNCYTFNGIGSNNFNKNVSKTDPGSGLSLVVFTDTYTDTLTSDPGVIYNPSDPTSGNNGIRVIVHSPKTRPAPVDKGFDVPNGFSTTVALRATRRTLLTEPHGDCTTDASNKGTEYRYTTDICYEQCHQDIITQKCGCKSSHFIPPRNETGFQYCGKLNITNLLSGDDTSKESILEDFTHLECEKSVIDTFWSNVTMVSKCNCRPPCNSTYYIKTTSQAVWPNEFTQQSFYKTYVNITDSTARPNILFQGLTPKEIKDRGLIQKNFLRLNIYFEDLQVEETSQEADYPITQVISDIGGNMGFYVGVSVITLVEFLSLIGALLLIFFKSCIKAGGKLREAKVSDVNIQPAHSLENKLGAQYTYEYKSYNDMISR